MQRSIGGMHFKYEDFNKLIAGIYELMAEETLKDRQLRCIAIASLYYDSTSLYSSLAIVKR